MTYTFDAARELLHDNGDDAALAQREETFEVVTRNAHGEIIESVLIIGDRAYQRFEMAPPSGFETADDFPY